MVEAIGRLAGQAGLDSTLVEPVLKTAAISILTKVTGRCAGPPGGGAAAFVEGGRDHPGPGGGPPAGGGSADDDGRLLG